MDPLAILQIAFYFSTIMILAVALLLKLAMGKGTWSYIVFMATIVFLCTFLFLGGIGVIEKEVGRTISPFFLVSFIGGAVYSRYLSKKNL